MHWEIYSCNFSVGCFFLLLLRLRPLDMTVSSPVIMQGTRWRASQVRKVRALSALRYLNYVLCIRHITQAYDLTCS